jgi:alkylation response protein AidB-like acyl-CoA dehydrogenase
VEFELGHATPAGAQLAELASKHAADFEATAERHDREGTFPFENWTEMRRSGFLAATVPTELGGMGVTALEDLVVAISRLARGDPSTAIGAAMHSTAFWYLARLLAEQSRAGADQRFVAGLRLLLRRCARGRVVACVAISETGTSLGHPLAAAQPHEDGYLISGRKTFCTNSPAATIFLSSVRVPTEGRGDLLGFALIPRETPGVTVGENWDALGMRASGSGDVMFSSCRVPSGMVTASSPVGVMSAQVLPLTMAGALVLAGAFLGIAERAQATAVDAAGGRQRDARRPASGARPIVQAAIGENEADLATSRAVLSRTAVMVAEGLRRTADAEPGVMHGLMKEVQCANMAVKRAAIAIVDRSLTISGGRGYLSSNVLSRLYRDVRAGPFMQPFSALDAFEYIGRVTLGLRPEGGMTKTPDDVAIVRNSPA